MVAKLESTQAEKLKGLIHNLRSFANMLDNAGNEIKIDGYEFTLKRAEIPDFSDRTIVTINVDDDVNFSIFAKGTFVNN